MGERRFVVELIKPSHYDDDGYVIQWVRSWIPSNSLACLYAIAQDVAARRALGPDVAIEINAYDECHTVIPIKRIIRRIKAADGGLVCLVGVQSNQFPRAVDIARAVPRRRHPGRDRRVSRLGLHGDAAGTAARHRRGARHRDRAVRRRGRGTARPGVRRRARRRIAADLQFHERSAGLAAAGHAVSADRDRPALQRDARARSTPGAAVRSSAASARSSTCRGASRAGATPTMSSGWCAPTSRRGSIASSSPTTISPATAIGRRSSTG